MTSSRRYRWVATVAIAPLVVVFVGQPAFACTSSWSTTTFGAAAFHPQAVDVVTADDAFVVGAITTPNGFVAAIRHWNGSSWSPFPSPSFPGTGTAVQLVSAAADDDIWVSANGSANGVIAVWLAHWDGGAWTVMPDDISRRFSVTSLVAVSPSRAYAVSHSVIARWNGTSWHRLSVPVHADLNAVVASAPHDVWVLGDRFMCSPCIDRTVTWHWDGSTWLHVPSPNGTSGNVISAAVEIAPSDVWAVGSAKRSSGAEGSMAMHWNGATWTMRLPDPSAGDAFLSVDATGPNDVWAAGSTWPSNGPGPYGRIERWTPGAGWTITPDPSPIGSTYTSIGVSLGHAWAVGYTSTGNGTTLDPLAVSLCPA